jgi:hypothetical protein
MNPVTILQTCCPSQLAFTTLVIPWHLDVRPSRTLLRKPYFYTHLKYIQATVSLQIVSCRLLTQLNVHSTFETQHVHLQRHLRNGYVLLFSYWLVHGIIAHIRDVYECTTEELRYIS